MNFYEFDLLLESKKPKELSKISKKDIENIETKNIKNKSLKVKAKDLKAMQKNLDPKKTLQITINILLEKYKPDNIIVSKDKHIVDGHHKWAGQMLIDPEQEIDVEQINKKTPDLITLLNYHTKTKYRSGNDTKEHISDFQSNINKLLTKFLKEGIKDQYPISKKDVNKAIKILGKNNLEKGIETINKNSKEIKEPNKNALKRKDMPVIKSKKEIEEFINKHNRS